MIAPSRDSSKLVKNGNDDQHGLVTDRHIVGYFAILPVCQEWTTGLIMSSVRYA